ncbi:hypothetical protein [Dickeya solani]|uniref:Uncharacterized protein n=1 Tax=Dickeya solani TaxID=1089444 RepID=A0AAX4F246_9GAMM|nr:hypothetical protein [Dickeya solani]WOA53691.1 hypothetical protein RXA29_05495 [Dickeya solani]
MHRRRNSVLLVAVLFIGDALLQVPLGWVSDTLDVGGSFCWGCCFWRPMRFRPGRRPGNGGVARPACIGW